MDDRTFVDILRDRAQLNGDKVAYRFLVDGDKEELTLTYGQLHQRALAIASVLKEEAKPGDRALLLYPPGLEFICAFFGCLYAGVIAVPAYPPGQSRLVQNLKRLELLSRNCTPAAVLCDDSIKAIIDETITAEIQQSVLQEIDKESNDSNSTLALLKAKIISTSLVQTAASESIIMSPSAQDLVFLQYTSGSTGHPKGVMVSHGNLVHNSQRIKCTTKVQPGDILASWLPQYHDMGLIGSILKPIYCNMLSILCRPEHFLQKPLSWLHTVSRYGVNLSGGPNFAYELCVNRYSKDAMKDVDLSCWNFAYSSSEPVCKDTIERFVDIFKPHGFNPNNFFPLYGMAEHTLMISAGTLGEPYQSITVDKQSLLENQAVEAQSSESIQTFVSCGRALDDHSITIVDSETKTSLNDNEVGEIWCKGPSVAQGYWGNEEVTKETFHAYTEDDQGPFLRTGDLGFLKDGELYIVGRLKDMIIIRGRNYAPQDIEYAVEAAHEGIRKGCVAAFGFEEAGVEKLAVICEIKRTYIKKDHDEIIQAIIENIARENELSVSAIVLLKPGKIFKTTSGKIQRRKTKHAHLNSELTVLSAWQAADDQDITIPDELPLSKEAIEAQLKNWLAARLCLANDSIKTATAFMDLGLDSIASVEASDMLSRWLGQEINPAVFWEYASIASLSVYLAELLGLVQKCSSPGSVSQKRDHMHEPIAIVGMGCRFPGANNIESFWQNLKQGMDVITEVPSDRWDAQQYYSASAQPGKMTTKWGGFLKDIDQFDASFFNISPKEAQSMDPQQRLLLEVVWEALESAAINPFNLREQSASVFIGAATQDYAKLFSQQSDEHSIDAYLGTGGALSALAGRISYCLGLTGPAMVLDTACSSSLVALHEAARSIQNSECDFAIAGGVNVILDPELTIAFSQAQMMAGDGRCKVFSDQADGYVRSEGCGVVLLKRLSDALRDGDDIHAVIKGSAINQDGASNGFTAPSGQSQRELMQRALQSANVKAEDVEFIECHGTGTSLGDPIECRSIQAVYGNNRQEPIKLGSVKSNIGHSEAAAGIAGLIKASLALKHQQLPANLHVGSINPNIDMTSQSLEIITELQPWLPRNNTRHAAVSSFGFTGTNAHVVLEEAPQVPARQQPEVQRPLHVLPLSAKSEAALDAQISQYQTYLNTAKDKQTDLGDICYTAGVGKAHFDYRLAVVGESIDDIQIKLQTKDFIQNKVANQSKLKIAWLFTGQGSQRIKLGHDLYDTHQVFKQAIDQCAQYLKDKHNYDFNAIWKSEDESLISQTQHTQVLLFVVEYALAQLWLSFGVKPDYVCGHSVGEYVAATIADVMSLEDGLTLIYHRGRLMQSLPEGGGMLVALTDLKTIKGILKDNNLDLSIAGINASKQIVLSGEIAKIKKLESILIKQEIRAITLNVSHAFHSKLMQPICEEFKAVASKVEFKVPQIKLLSNVTGDFIKNNQVTADYWVEHILNAVNFTGCVKTIEQAGCDIYQEIGPDATLIGLAQHTVSSTDVQFIASLSLDTNTNDWQSILSAVSQLYTQGVEIDWEGYEKPYLRQKVQLPTYPFQRERYWVKDSKALSSSIDKLFFDIKWQKKDFVAARAGNLTGTWLTVGLPTDSIATLKSGNRECNLINIKWRKGFKEYKRGIYQFGVSPVDKDSITAILETLDSEVKGVIYFASSLSSEHKEPNIKQAQEHSAAGLLYLTQALVESKSSPRLIVLTENAVPFVNEEAHLDLYGSLASGMLKTINIEHPEFASVHIDVDSLSSENLVNALKLQLKLSNDDKKEDQVLLRGSNYFVPRMVSETVPKSNNIEFDPESSYLITGGLGGLGLACCEWMVERGAKRVILVSRRDINDEVKPKLSDWKDLGVNVDVLSHDISTMKAWCAIKEHVNKSGSKLAGVCHLAGILDNALLMNLDWSQFQKSYQAKVSGLLAFQSVFANDQFEFEVYFSSLASITGNIGQANYASANAFVDGFSALRRSQGHQSFSFNLGAVSDIGMWNESQQGSDIVSDTASMKPEQLYIAIERCLSGDASRTILVNLDSLNEYVNYSYLPLFSLFAENNQRQSKTNIINELVSLNEQDRREQLLQFTSITLADVLGVDDISGVDNQKGFFDQGMDSLLAIEFTKILRDKIGVEIGVSFLFGSSNIVKLVDIIMSQMDELPSVAIQANDVSFSSQNIHIQLSFAEHRIYSQYMADYEKAAMWNDYFALIIEGEFNCDIFCRSLEIIIRRHPQLRASYHHDGKMPFKSINSVKSFNVCIKELGECRAYEDINASLSCDFNLEEGETFKVVVYKINKFKHIALFLFYHIVHDAWSIFSIFLPELSYIYEQKTLGKEVVLEELKSDYSTYSLRQCNVSLSITPRCIEYWLNELDEVRAAPMFCCRKETNEMTVKGGIVSRSVEFEFSDCIEAIPRSHNCTISVYLLSVLYSTLAEYYGIDDVHCMVNFHGRGADYVDVFGNFVEIFPLMQRNLLDGPLEESISLINNTINSSMNNFIPISVLKEELFRRNIRSDYFSDLPVVNILNMKNMKSDLFDFPSLDVKCIDLFNGIAKRPLTFRIIYSGSMLDLRVEYLKDMYRQETIDDISNLFFDKITQFFHSNSNLSIEKYIEI